MRSLTEAMRALILVSSEIMERAHDGDAKCKLKEGFLIPIIKGWSTELAQEVTSNGLQIHGGMGFIEIKRCDIIIFSCKIICTSNLKHLIT